jgi:formamidopyrimidine-DNA glycosylase
VPELPEVETIVRDLRPLLVGRHILSVERTSELALRRPWESAWNALLQHRRIDAVNRRGKWIVLHLDDGSFLVFHLGMTGQLTVVDADTPPGVHLHLVLTLDGPAQQLRFRDIRRFGSGTRFANQTELQGLFAENGLGPEPFDLDARLWRAKLAETTRAIKAVLMDQGVVAGVGNIYADEALFVAKLHPSRRACDLTGAEADRLRRAVARVLTTAIEKRGASIRNYVGGSGLQGGYQEEFLVYGRKAQPCSRCRTAIASIRLGGRSAHFCPSCQPSAISSQPDGRQKKRRQRPPASG